jgi:hypothetical protein
VSGSVFFVRAARGRGGSWALCIEEGGRLTNRDWFESSAVCVVGWEESYLGLS